MALEVIVLLVIPVTNGKVTNRLLGINELGVDSKKIPTVKFATPAPTTVTVNPAKVTAKVDNVKARVGVKAKSVRPAKLRLIGGVTLMDPATAFDPNPIRSNVLVVIGPAATIKARVIAGSPVA